MRDIQETLTFNSATTVSKNRLIHCGADPKTATVGDHYIAIQILSPLAGQEQDGCRHIFFISDLAQRNLLWRDCDVDVVPVVLI